MAETTFLHGEFRTVQYTPTGGNVSQGQVVLLGSVTANTAGEGAVAGIALHDIVNNTQGTLSVFGGVHSAVNLNNAATGKKVYWDDTNNKVTTASTNNAVFGWIVKDGAAGANTACQVFHNPYHNVN